MIIFYLWVHRHSLLAAIVVGKINDRFGTTLSTLTLFANPTVEALSKIVDTGENNNMEIVDLEQELIKYAVKPM